MSKTAIPIISCVLLLALVGSVSAATYVWDKGGTTKLWSVAANWNPDGVPTAADTAQLSLADANCVIDSTVTALCSTVLVGGASAGNCYLEMPGGTLTASTTTTGTGGIQVGQNNGAGVFIMSGGTATTTVSRLWVGYNASATGTLVMRGGTMNVGGDKIEIAKNAGGVGTVYIEGGVLNLQGPSADLEIANSGTGTFQMTGGTVNVLDQIKLAQAAAGIGRLNLYGGTISANSLLAVASVLGTPKIDITKGTLILNGDRTALVNDYLSRGWLVAYNGTGQVIVTFSAGANQTIVTGYKVEAYFASNPAPADTATAQRSPALSWKPGIYAASHDVYFGASFNDVNTAGRTNPLGVLVAQGQDANTYNPAGPLDFGRTYYWRIDEVNAAPSTTIYKGAVWSFTVETLANPVTNITATASSTAAGSDPANTINGSGLTGDLHSTATTAMWATAGNVTSPVWIRYDFDRLYKLQEMWVWNYNGDFEYLLGFGMKNVTVEYSMDGLGWKTLGNYVFPRAPSAAGYAHDTTISFGGLAAKSVKITATSNYGGTSYGLSEVRFYSIPVQARQPQPADGAQNVGLNPTLSWWAGREAVSHNVYLGADPNALPLAGTVTASSYDAALNLGTTYYWRVDEVNMAAAITTWTGSVWSFTTINHLVLDDMESYDDTSHPVYDTWVDGYGTTTNGSQIGYGQSANSTFNATKTVHGGNQSMPFKYDNAGSVTTSEAVRTFDTLQDWTRVGIGSLALYFYGQTANTTTVPFWIKLTDQSGKTAKVTYGTVAGEDVTNLAKASWTQWNIPLSSFSGVTLSKIKSMTIGFGPGAGTGTIFIDDIQLGTAK
jgi:hypothetical protein